MNIVESFSIGLRMTRLEAFIVGWSIQYRLVKDGYTLDPDAMVTLMISPTGLKYQVMELDPSVEEHSMVTLLVPENG